MRRALLLLILAVTLALLGLNHVVRRTVEQQTARSLNLPTAVDSAVVSVLGSGVHLQHFRIASPSGYSADPMLVLDSTQLGLRFTELYDDPVHVSTILFVKPRLLIENINGKLNFQKLIDDLPPVSPHPLKLVIDEVTVQDATVVLRPGLPGMAREIVVPVPTFTLLHIGTHDGRADGALVREVIARLIRALVAHASDSEQLPAELRLLIKGDVRGALVHAIPGGVGKVLGGLLRPGAGGPAPFDHRTAAPLVRPTTAPTGAGADRG